MRTLKPNSFYIFLNIVSQVIEAAVHFYQLSWEMSLWSSYYILTERIGGKLHSQQFWGHRLLDLFTPETHQRSDGAAVQDGKLTLYRKWQETNKISENHKMRTFYLSAHNSIWNYKSFSMILNMSCVSVKYNN